VKLQFKQQIRHDPICERAIFERIEMFVRRNVAAREEIMRHDHGSLAFSAGESIQDRGEHIKKNSVALVR
jgi:hypothetical protein